MSAQNNGGPAFPFLELDGAGSPYHQNEGLSVLDYFAAKAMQMHGTCLGGIAVSQEEWDELVAERAYKTARAMLKARSS